MAKIIGVGRGLLVILALNFWLIACGENAVTSTAVSSGTNPASTSEPGTRILSEKDSGTTVRLKVGETLLAGFNPDMSWGFQLEPASPATLVLSSSTEGVPQPYQAKFEAENPGTVKIKAEGSCLPQAGKLCHQAIILYNFTVTVS